ncbi:hypothetical protein [Vibrio hangzhouensis]|uniref:hypothetical protein n=1 Tax=Vibrio hangzhouensis TaxID=462991 RepID=UPI001C947E3B|nr:hypothetical protein [Vibrio hangzhouensis]MBY6197332.1 hypothetical protein [Vibrio hangzhouensis]
MLINNVYSIKLLLPLLFLTGCGDEGGIDLINNDGDFVGDGIYINDTDFVVMLVDSKRESNNLVIGDFEGNSVYFVDSAVTIENKMITKGLTYADSYNFLKDENLVLNAEFNASSADVKGQEGGLTVTYSLDKAASSLPLEQLVGTYTNPEDGSVWTINPDGSFIVSGVCTITGQAQRTGAYFSVLEAEAVGCSEPVLEGTYFGAFMTVNHQSQDYVTGLLGNDYALIWGSAPIN